MLDRSQKIVEECTGNELFQVIAILLNHHRVERLGYRIEGRCLRLAILQIKSHVSSDTQYLQERSISWIREISTGIKVI
jgi:hypothetical protein